MVLFLMRGDSSREPVPGGSRVGSKERDYTTELLIAALVLSGWCVSRFFVSGDTSHGVDAVLGTACLALGAWTVLRCLRLLRVGQSARRAARARARALEREHRANRRRARAQRHN